MTAAVIGGDQPIFGFYRCIGLSRC